MTRAISNAAGPAARKTRAPNTKGRPAAGPVCDGVCDGAGDGAGDGARDEAPASPAPIVKLAVSKHYQPFPRQAEFHNSGAKYRLFGGAAGPGKTKALLWEAIRQANAYEKVDTLLLRRTFPELESSLLSYFRRDVPRDIYRSYNDSKHIVTWLNGSTTRFGYSAGENDIYQYQGAEYLFIGIDELTLFTLPQWQFLTSRNRCARQEATPNMAGASNPGNVGHAWVKALWVDRRAAPGMDRPEQYDPRDYDFIRATLDDNPIFRDDAGYRKALDALPRHLRQAFLYGDWDVFAGQYFDNFDYARNTERAELLGGPHGAGGRMEDWWPRWISIDWGFEHPSAVYWHAARPDGCVLTYREFVANHLSPRMLAQAIVERSRSAPRDSCAFVAQGAPSAFGQGTPSRVVIPSGARDLHFEPFGMDCPIPERICEIFLSPDAFAHRTSDSSIAEQLGEVFAQNGLPRPAPADDDRIGGWMLMCQKLEEGKWLIARNCERLLECLPTLVRDPANIEDVLKANGDDPADSARYGLKSRLAPGRMPAEMRVAERVAALDAMSSAAGSGAGGGLDATSRAIWMQKFMAEEQRHRRAAPLPHRWARVSTLRPTRHRCRASESADPSLRSG